MFKRLLKPSLSNSFFLFGSRGSGKTTFLKNLFRDLDALWINLLDSDIEERYALDPGLLYREITKEKKQPAWVVIDEVQKNPRLLDVVHRLIEDTNVKFALTGSSARKLKKGAANLLAGRAFVNHLFPLTAIEMKEKFNLEQALAWGTLPKITQLSSEEDKHDFLKAYTHTYLKEEVWGEHLIRKIAPFRKFLPVAAQMSGQILNYLSIARDVGADYKTIQAYYEILEDTLIGFSLPAYHQSIRKQQQQAIKFYLFDTGVKRALDNSLRIPLQPKTYAYGQAFEHWCIAEIHRLNHYYKNDFELSYLRTKDQAEIDLIVERPGKSTCLIEIKATNKVNAQDTSTLARFQKDFKNAEAFVFSNDPHEQSINGILCLSWQQGIQNIFSLKS
jgi:predicted AAA+ superfamily ATPase